MQRDVGNLGRYQMFTMSKYHQKVIYVNNRFNWAVVLIS